MRAMMDHLYANRSDKGVQMLEVGSWIGSSAQVWLDAFKEHEDHQARLLCCDAWRNTYGMDGFEAQYPAAFETADALKVMATALNTGTAEALFRHNIAALGGTDCVDVLHGKSEHTLPYLRPNHFDVVYLDAAHAYTPVKHDLVNAMKLVKDGGILCGDDLELSWTECDQAFADANLEADMITDPLTDHMFHPGVAKAIHETLGHVTRYWGFWIAKRVGDGWRPVDLTEHSLHMPSDLPEYAEALGQKFLEIYEKTFTLDPEQGRRARIALCKGTGGAPMGGEIKI